MCPTDTRASAPPIVWLVIVALIVAIVVSTLSEYGVVR